ncbi:gamma-glutamyl carboxylase isoform X1 [Choristoneura fumiferana]|uniref:gamma-glutamyl carboxylase isoform X1 n=1 Tax=Choristoneura fumiferana TaxID=7141 RepID=UPI003D157339
MKFKDIFMIYYGAVNERFREQFGFNIKDTTFEKVALYLHAPKHASSLALTRILFGLMMLFDIPDERGGATMQKRWGDPKSCHFPLFTFIQAIPMPYMALVYAALWIGAVGMTLGYKYRISATLFTICFWYLFLIEKSYWNNHSYLFALVSFLLACTEADCYWSIDTFLEPENFCETVPYWNYFLLKYQFFILYFVAGLKKGTSEWLTGYSVPNLSAHWVFTPFTLFLTVEQTDYLIVHWFIYLFDLTVAFWMMWSRSRHMAMVFCALFHLMNSRLFTIGMFPWVCLATMPLFYPFDWPILLLNFLKSFFVTFYAELRQRINNYSLKLEPKTVENESEDENDDVFVKDHEKGVSTEGLSSSHDQFVQDGAAPECVSLKNCDNDVKNSKERKTINGANLTLQKDELNSEHQSNHVEVGQREKITTILIIMYMIMQVFLPFSHFITKGYNNWTNGIYGYSWDMMVHTWDIQSVIVKLVDNEKNSQFYVDPYVLTPNDRWFKHGDMIQQYAMCLKNNLAKESRKPLKHLGMPSQNISIYIDVWCSLNGRFVQRMFNPKLDLLQISWSFYQDLPFLMPIIDNATEWRSVLHRIRKDVHGWNQHSDVVFFADFSGYALKKFIPTEFSNVTLTVLQGQVAFEPEVTKYRNGQSYKLNPGYGTSIDAGMFHRVINIGKETAFYMYTFYNTTEANLKKNDKVVSKHNLPIFMELKRRFSDMLVFADNMYNGLYQLFFRLSMFLVSSY